MSEKRDLLTRFGARLDLPREALPGGFSILLSGQGELSVRGRARILSYKENESTIYPEFVVVESFENGYAAVKKENGKWGFIDTTGKEQIEADYDEVKNFGEVFAEVKEDGKWIYIERPKK